MGFSVKREYLKLLKYFDIQMFKDRPRFTFRVSGRDVYVVAIVEEVTWGAMKPYLFEGELVYQDPASGEGLFSQRAAIDASEGSCRLLGGLKTGMHIAFESIQ